MSQPPYQSHPVTSFAPSWQSAPSCSMIRVTVKTCTARFVFVSEDMLTAAGLEEQLVLKLWCRLLSVIELNLL